ncbi:MAG: hypothetical protein F2667_00255 [Actinobacteria bacterium]|nr:hypothetical protein [Actinomycetota bacterium]
MAPLHEVTIAHALFTYGELNQIALRGAVIQVDQEDYDRGQAEGAFLDTSLTGTLERHGNLPDFDFDEDDSAEINSWMRSASVDEISAALTSAAEEGRDITALMAAGELSRGAERRQEVFTLLNAAKPDITAETISEPAPESSVARTRLTALIHRMGFDPEVDDPSDFFDQLETVVEAGLQALLDPMVNDNQVDQQAEQQVEHVGAAPVESLSDRIDDITARVGQDKELARLALEHEQTTKGDNARPRLVSALQKVIDAPGGEL